MTEIEYPLKKALNDCINAITAAGTKQSDGTYVQRFGQAFVDMLIKIQDDASKSIVQSIIVSPDLLKDLIEGKCIVDWIPLQMRCPTCGLSIKGRLFVLENNKEK